MTVFPLIPSASKPVNDGVVPALRLRREPLLAATLLGLLALAGCGDDEGAVPIVTPDSGTETTSDDTTSTGATEAGTGSATNGSNTAAPADAGDDGENDAGTGVASTGAPDGAVADYDRDGVSAADGDCDDFNHSIYPGAEERSHDGLDSDCDGEELPVPELVWSAALEDNVVDVLALFDENDDGEISEAEFALACASSASATGDARPGIVELHASCAGSNSCRGMVYQSWNELYEHSCRGVNACAGWSCVETAPDEGRSGPEAFTAATCDYCHTGEAEGAFLVKVPPDVQDVDTYVSTFFTSRSDEYLRSVIAFGVRGVAPDGQAFSNMPGAITRLSREEIDTLIGYLRTLPLERKVFEYIASNHEDEEPMPDAGSATDAGLDASFAADAGQ